MKSISLSETENCNSIPVLSDFLEIKCSENMGRGLFVSKNIKPGKLL